MLPYTRFSVQTERYLPSFYNLYLQALTTFLWLSLKKIVKFWLSVRSHDACKWNFYFLLWHKDWKYLQLYCAMKHRYSITVCCFMISTRTLLTALGCRVKGLCALLMETYLIISVKINVLKWKWQALPTSITSKHYRKAIQASIT